MKAYEKNSGSYDKIEVSYYPGMVEILMTDNWNDLETHFNMSMSDWRALNVAVEAAHNGEE